MAQKHLSMGRLLVLLLSIGFYSIVASSDNIQFGMVFGGGEWSSIYSKYDSQIAYNSLISLKNTGCTHIRILHQWYQDNINSTTMYPILTNSNSSLVSPTDDELSSIINVSHSLGFKTVLAPVLDPNWDLSQYQSRNGWCYSSTEQEPIPCKDKQHWRGQIGTYFNSTDWNEWFVSYNKYIIKYAQFAEQHNVFMYEAASELGTTFGQQQLWRDLISSIRNVYSGKLTIAGYQNIHFWDALDYIGLEGYIRLHGDTVQDFKNDWNQTVINFANYAAKWNKSLIITELGYQSRPSGFQHAGGNERYDADDCSMMEYICFNQTLQAYAYEAFFQSFMNETWFEGVYFWLWRTDSWQGGDSDFSFSPHAKDAEKVFYKYATNKNESDYNFTYYLDYEYPQQLVFDKNQSVINVVNKRMNGFNFGDGIWSSFKYPYGSDGAYKSLENMRIETGSNTVRIIASSRFNNYSSPYFYQDEWTPNTNQLETIFEQANKLGFERIIFAPYLDESFPLKLKCSYTDQDYSKPSCDGKTNWRGYWGQLWDDSDWITFFENYNELILHYIPLLNKYNISDYCIATELMSMVTTHSSNFIDIINNVRNNGYSGNITIDFNRESNINISLYEALDYIGQSGYYSLNISMNNKTEPWRNPTLNDVINAWKPHIEQLSNISKLAGNKKIVFTEIGYQSRPWPWINPPGTQQLDGMDCSVWDQCYNMAHQAFMYEGLFRSVYLQEWFDGVIWWLWRTDPNQGGPVDDSFTPRGKPAVQILKKYWT